MIGDLLLVAFLIASPILGGIPAGYLADALLTLRELHRADRATLDPCPSASSPRPSPHRRSSSPPPART